MDFKNFAVASTTSQDVANTPLDKMILLGSAFILDFYIGPDSFIRLRGISL